VTRSVNGSLWLGSRSTEPPESDLDLYRLGTPTRDALERMANRWTVLVTHVLEDGPTRFNTLKNRLGVSSPVLTRVLRDFERDGLIRRMIYAEVSMRVEYSLTPLGGTVLGCSRGAAVGGKDRPRDRDAGELFDAADRCGRPRREAAVPLGRAARCIRRQNRPGL
jgi:DNA-binding HxlR family transcriptional regulator